ncbi:hypothetical protein [Arthrobacter sp. B1I2]|nr:hypothetical protein [Arthrobacter sp. B1I2]MDQ0733236.1 hypothetical protein [Arthrobacter sp. B1I2]
MILTGTVSTPDNAYDYSSAEGSTYEEARARLDMLLQEGQKLIIIRAERD